MITDDELAELPEDPELAFVELERIVRSRLKEQEQNALLEGDRNKSSAFRLDYINQVVAAARAYGIEALANWDVQSVSQKINFDFRSFTLDVDSFTTQVRIRHAPRKRDGSVALDDNARARIHHHIQQIRTAIEGAKLPEPKRDSLYKKLNGFALEVDRNRTSLQAGMAVYIGLCDAIGQGFKKLEPARKFFNSIAAVLGRAKEAEESSRPSIPRSEERKQLEAPPKKLSPPESSGDLDDDVPF